MFISSIVNFLKATANILRPSLAYISNAFFKFFITALLILLFLSNFCKITLSAPFINKYISSGFAVFCKTTLIDLRSEEYSNRNGILNVISDKSELHGFFISILLLSFLPKNIYLYFLAKFKMATSSGEEAWYINFLFKINSFSSTTPLWHVAKAVINKSSISF